MTFGFDILAAGWAGDLAVRLGTIFYTIVLPVLLLVGVGWLIQRTLGLDLATLTRLNFYFVIPALIYVSLITRPIEASSAGAAIAFALLLMAGAAAVAWAAMRLGRVTPGRRAAVLMTVIFFNSGNFSIPLQKLAFAPWGRGDEAAGLQVVIMLVQNVATFTLGVLLASAGQAPRSWRQTARHMVRFPPLYALVAALVTLYVRSALGDRAPEVARTLSPFWAAIRMAGDAFMAIALVTLGAQLAQVGRRHSDEPLALPILLRLAAGPLIGLALVLVLGRWLSLDPLTAQVMLIAACAPTALNSVLMCLEFDNHPAMVARVVLWTTLLAPVVVTVAIAFARSGAVEGLSLAGP